MRVQALLPDMPRCYACCRAFGGLLQRMTRKLLPCIILLVVLLSLFGIAIIGSTARVNTTAAKAGLRPSAPTARTGARPPAPSISPPPPPPSAALPSAKSIFADPQLELAGQEVDAHLAMDRLLYLVSLVAGGVKGLRYGEVVVCLFPLLALPAVA